MDYRARRLTRPWHRSVVHDSGQPPEHPQPFSEQPVSGRPVSGQPGSEQSGSGQPVSERPGSEQPVSGQPGSGRAGSGRPGAGRPGSGRLPGVDGLRAFAALWVVLFHMGAFSGGPLWPGIDLLVRSGSTGVSLFLVLSGFCLYLPYAGGRLDRFRTTASLRRRCARLLPAYYTSLAIVIVAHAVGGGLPGLPRMGAAELTGQAAAHATLTHQFMPSTFYALNGAYWSLGLEWELYLTLPILILAVRRFGLG